MYLGLRANNTQLEKLHNEELHDFYRSPDVIREIKSKRMRSLGPMARIGGREIRTQFWWINMTRINHLEDISVDESIILKWVLRE